MTYFQVVSGDTIQPDHMNAAIKQGAIPFASAAARTSVSTLAPYEGMLTYLQDVNRYESWNGTAWVPLLNTHTVTWDYCAMALSGVPGMAAPVDANKLVAPYTTKSGTHQEWGDLATGMITVPTAGVYVVQWTGALTAGGGWLNFTIHVDDVNTRLTGNETERSTAIPEVFLLGTYITYPLAAGARIHIRTYVRNHTAALSAKIWGTLLVGRPMIT
jgi:hypothetical protein